MRSAEFGGKAAPFIPQEMAGNRFESDDEEEEEQEEDEDEEAGNEPMNEMRGSARTEMRPQMAERAEVPLGERQRSQSAPGLEPPSTTKEDGEWQPTLGRLRGTRARRPLIFNDFGR